MPSYLYFNQELNPESISKFVDQVQSMIDWQAEKPKIKLYISTMGGMVESAFVMADFLISLREADGVEIDFVVCENFHSSALLALAHINRHNDKSEKKINIYIYSMSEGVLHEIAEDINTRNPPELMEKYLGEIGHRRMSVLNFFRKHLTKKEIKDFSNSKDVILESDRLAKIFNAKIVEFF